MKVHVLICTKGQWSDTYTYTVGVYATKELAQARIDAETNKEKEYEEKKELRDNKLNDLYNKFWYNDDSIEKKLKKLGLTKEQIENEWDIATEEIEEEFDTPNWYESGVYTINPFELIDSADKSIVLSEEK